MGLGQSGHHGVIVTFFVDMEYKSVNGNVIIRNHDMTERRAWVFPKKRKSVNLVLAVKVSFVFCKNKGY